MKFSKFFIIMSTFVFILASSYLVYAFPTSWWVNGNGYTGFLTYQVNQSTNRLNGKLLGTNVEGYLVGRHIVLHRYPEGKDQIWEG